MTTAVIIGTGNVARHLFDAFRVTKSVKVVQVLGRSQIALAFFKEVCETAPLTGAIKDADIYIIAVSDDAVIPVSQLLKLKNKFTVHTSGSLKAGELHQPSRKGVLYPLQTFSREREINFREVPVCIEAEDPDDLEILKAVAGALSDRVYELPFSKRRQLHLAAVLVNNFGNHLCHLADELLRAEMLPFEMMLPLIRETTAKLERITPREAQTGPARRGDLKTMEEQLKLLPEGTYRELYDLMNNSIKKTYAKDV